MRKKSIFVVTLILIFFLGLSLVSANNSNIDDNSLKDQINDVDNEVERNKYYDNIR